MITLFATLAHSQWIEQRIQEGDEDLVPVGVAIRQWGPTDEVFFAVESRVPEPDGDHTLAVQHWTCGDSSCTTATINGLEDPIGDALRLGQYWFPSMAIQRLDPQGESGERPRQLHIVARDRIRANCVGNGAYESFTNAFDNNVRFLDLREFRWDTSAGAQPANPSGQVRMGDFDEICEDAQLSWTKVFSGTGEVHTSYTWNENPDNIAQPTGVPDVEVARSAPPAQGNGWDRLIASRWYWYNGDPVVQQNPSFDFYDDDARAVAYDVTDGARVQFVDDATPWNHDVEFPGIAGTGINARPSIAYHVASGRYHLVGSPENSQDVLYTTCQEGLGVDCLDGADWSVPTIIGQGDHASVEVDGDKVFVVYENAAVYVLSQCVGDASWNVQVPRAPVGGRLQSLYSGRPTFAINKQANVLHVAFTERPQTIPNEVNPDEGDAWWVRRTYNDCP